MMTGAGGPPMSRMMTGQGGGSEARPMTSVSGAGFTSKGATQKTFDPMGVANRGPAPALAVKSDNSPEDMAKEMEKQVKTVTQLKINKKYTLRRMVWTEFQRSAASNTLDSFVYGFPRRYPMLSDLKCTEENHDVIHNFLLALLKANVSIKTIKDVCDEQLHVYFYKGTVVPLHVVFNTQSRFDTLMNAVEALK